MKETRIPNLNIDPVGIRLERIVEEKKAANEEALGKIKSLTDNWEELNKSIETDIKDEFELMDLEDQALVDALEDLQENRNNPDKKSFTINGKVIARKEKIGLPNVTVVVLQKAASKAKPLPKAVTDNLGNFVFRLGPAIIGDSERPQLEVEYQVIAGGGTLLHSEVQSLHPRLGGIAQVVLAVAETDEVSNQLEAGKAVKDSILGTRDLIASRVENMRGAHDALAKMAGITRDDLDILHEELAVTPPEVITTLSKPTPTPKPGNKPERPRNEEPSGTDDEDKPLPPGVEEPGDTDGEDRPVPPRLEQPVRPGRALPDLVDIDGIGPERAKLLTRANIKDVKTFTTTDDRELTEILGRLDFKAMKKHARKL